MRPEVRAREPALLWGHCVRVVRHLWALLTVSAYVVLVRVEMALL
jgi:hypothetical protein